MIDAFTLFNESRCPWLDPDRLKEKFLVLSAQTHPDRFHQAPESEGLAATQRYADLNAAYQRLRDPKDRLQHLFELEFGRKPEQVRSIDERNMTLFTEVGQLCRSADELLDAQAARKSPLLRIQFIERSADLTEHLKNLQARLNQRRKALEEELQSLNPLWEKALPTGSPSRTAALPWDRLEQMLQDFSYLRRWNQQLQDRVVRLSCPA
jgi:curved DNA-binding protein CbpA